MFEPDKQFIGHDEKESMTISQNINQDIVWNTLETTTSIEWIVGIDWNLKRELSNERTNFIDVRFVDVEDIEEFVSLNVFVFWRECEENQQTGSLQSFFMKILKSVRCKLSQNRVQSSFIWRENGTKWHRKL